MFASLLMMACVPHYGPVYSWAGFDPDVPRQLEASIPRAYLAETGEQISGTMRDFSCSEGVEVRSAGDPIVLVTKTAAPQVLQGQCLIRYARGAIVVKYDFASRGG